MVYYECPRCCYKTDRKSDIRNHFSKKNICKLNEENGVDENPIEFLNYLNDPITIKQHVKAINYIKSLENEIKNLKLQINNQKVVNLDGANVSGHGNISVDQSTTVNLQLVINNYNEPNTGYIQSKHCDIALKNGNLIEGCIQMAKLIWFNGNHPENHSIFKTNKKDNSVKCLENGKVNEYNLDTKFPTIMEVILDVFERSENESEKYYDLNYIFDNPDKHPKFFKCLENDLAKELYNHKELVKQTIEKLKTKSV